MKRSPFDEPMRLSFCLSHVAYTKYTESAETSMASSSYNTPRTASEMFGSRSRKFTKHFYVRYMYITEVAVAVDSGRGTDAQKTLLVFIL